MDETAAKDWDADGSVRACLDPNAPSQPLIISPHDPDTDLLDWAEENRDFVEEAVTRFGALMFRGFGLEDVEDFDEMVRIVSGGPLPYREQSSPRDTVYGNIYTSTSHPSGEAIVLHSEQSYNIAYPLRIYFYCIHPATTGGATPIADTRKVLERLPERLVTRFVEQGYLYVRNFGDGFGVPWQKAFGTEDREVVDRYCAEHDIEAIWKDGDRLRTRQQRDAVAVHPRSGARSWFNHIVFFHVTSLAPEVCATLRGELDEIDLPNQTFYGDGTPIEDEVIARIREAYEAERVAVPWQRGDLLMLDNVLTAHGREPFSGSRKVVVAMSDPASWAETRWTGQ